ncbi:acyltransferase family protein [Caenimonas soli]|uniref:acyltransferase family protein n=1 Tax=Caenimonas soli TaxID=2735555 RepID=UPI001557980F|nr:acyltransferase [Caenimonas soli]NPC56212.1 acyltransferase [Caenimonas soli]
MSIDALRAPVPGAVATAVNRGHVYYGGIQDLRGWAALLVVLYHAHVLFQKEKYFGFQVFGGFFEFGHRGVDLFFVISGFLMAMLTHEPEQKSRAWEFLLARARRIYVPFVPVMLGLTGGCLVFANACPAAYSFDTSTVLANLLIVPRENLDTFVPVVAWTLAHELFFYLMTFASLLLGRLGAMLLGLWLAASGAVMLAGMQLPFPWSFILSPYNIAFGLGFLAFKINRWRGVKIPARASLAVGACAFLALGAVEAFSGVPAGKAASTALMLGFFVSSFFLVLGFLGQPTRWVRPLGNASYSIYLVHYPLLVVLCMLLRFRSGEIALHLQYLALVAITLACAGAYYMLMERPALRLVGRRDGA